MSAITTCTCYSCGVRTSAFGVEISNSISPNDTRRILCSLKKTKRDAKLIVDVSNIHGMGCFSTTNFKRGDNISVCRGGIVLSSLFDQYTSCEEMTWNNSDARVKSCYCMLSSDHPTRFVNSSMVPNTVMCWDIYMVPRLVAKKRILAGQEITVKYPLFIIEDATPTDTTVNSLVAKWRASRVGMNCAQLKKAAKLYLGLD